MGLYDMIKRKVNKEFAQQFEMEKNVEKEAEKKLAKEALKAEYNEKRTLTLEKFFTISGLDFPEEFKDIKDHPVSDFTADSRKLTENSIFMYWGGPDCKKYTFDALPMALSKNCLLIITDTPCDYERVLYIPPSDDAWPGPVESAYINASLYIKNLHKAKTIAVTGSVGKTSAKEMIEAVLRMHYKNPLISKGNNNSMFSVTRNIQNLKRTTRVYLQEVGASRPKTIEISARQLNCDMVVYTNIGHSHIESYGDRDTLIYDKLSLSTFGKENGIAFVNFDDEVLMSYPFKQKVVSYSLKNPNAMYYAENIAVSGDSQTFDIVDKVENQRHSAQINVIGHHNILNAVASYAVGKALKIDTEEILEGIASYSPSGMRQNLINVGDYRVFADCYNSSLMAIESTLAAMDKIEIDKDFRKIVVLGDILELADISEETHRKIGAEILNHSVDYLLGYGNDIRHTIDEASALGVKAKYFSDRSLLEEEIRNIIKPGDLILFKASHGINLGSSIDRLFGTDINESSSIGHNQYSLVTEGDFEFYAFETSASLKRYLGNDSVVHVPSQIKATVTDGVTKETSVKVLNVEKIGKTAFRNMKYVKEAILPPTVVRIRDGAFKGSGVTRFKAPDSLLSIGSEAFANCPALETIEIPPKIKQLGEKVLADSPNAVVQCIQGSYPAKYAETNHYKYEYIK